MENEKVTLEKIDIIRQRTGISYSEAKQALELNNGNVVDTLVYLETQITEAYKERTEEFISSSEEFKKWLMGLVQKGNVTRLKIKKEDKVLMDMPVNVGIVAGIAALALPISLLGLGVAAAVATKLTVELTEKDGTVRVINAVIKEKAKDVSSKVNDMSSNIKDMVNEKINEMKNNNRCDAHGQQDDTTAYSYTVNFEEDKKENKEEKDANEDDNK